MNLVALLIAPAVVQTVLRRQPMANAWALAAGGVADLVAAAVVEDGSSTSPKRRQRSPHVRLTSP